MNTALFDLTGKIAFVTGGNRGIGKGIAMGLSNAGAIVVIAARDDQKTQETASEIEASGNKAFGVRCDVTDQ